MSIILTDLTKRFGDHLIVNRVSLEIRDGELFVLLGESGAGKSTILRLIAGLTQPDAGRIQIGGRDVTHLAPQERNTGFVFQNYSIFRHMTAAENIEFSLRLRRVPAQQRRRRSEELLELVNMAGLGNRYPHQLSGGQQQRVAIARALAQDPVVLLLDEPFGALDAKIRAQLRESLKEIQRRLGITTIQVTHDQEEAFSIADRIGIVDRGALVEVGSPDQLYHNPHTEFAATFVGGGNVLVGRVEGGCIQLGAATLPLPSNVPRHEDGAPIRVLFRPERVRLQQEPFAPESGVFPLARGLVRERVFAGPLQRLRLEVDALQGVRPLAPPPVYGQRSTLIEAVQPSDAAADMLAPGKALWIGVAAYHVLDPTGLKLLICVKRPPSSDAPTAFGCGLAQAAAGPASLLLVVDSAAAVADGREYLEALRRKYATHQPMIQTRIRQGTPATEILLEAQEGHYEIVILGRRPRLGPGALGPTALRLLEASETPLLLIGAADQAPRRMLICIAGGEPGKGDVLLGGRIARRTGAEVAILHVLPPRLTASDEERARRQLHQAQLSLEAQGVSSRYCLREGSDILQGILKEAEAGDYDLVVMGAPTSSQRQQQRGGDLVRGVVEGTTRSVLVVPVA